MATVIRDRSFWMGLFGVVVGCLLMEIVRTGPLEDVRADTQSTQGTNVQSGGVSEDVSPAQALTTTDRYIPFQAYLTDSMGKPIQGQRCLKFQIYNEATGDSLPFVWDEIRENVLVDNGMVNVVLGSVTPFPESATFDAARYVSVSVGESCTEMTTLEPRQQIISAVHAVDADRVSGSPGGFLANSVEIVPIGTITSWFGNPNTDLPSNWKLCNGQTINDSESTLNGQTVPNMSGRVARGAAGGESVGQMGGQDSDTWSVASHQHGISYNSAHSHGGTTSSAGGHSHSLSSVSGGGAPLCAEGASRCYLVGLSWTRNADSPGYERVQTTTGSGGTHPHSFGTSANGGHSHGGTTGSTGAAAGTIITVPSYVALHYIIRIK